MKKETAFDNSNTTTNSAQLEILITNFPQCFDKNGDFMPHKMQEVVAKDGINLSKEGYSLNWLGKSYARLLANEQPLTLLKADVEHNQKAANAKSENLLIKGDNLEVLKHLRRAYSEQVKMIYIDPPYNTGSDGFVYQDARKFTHEQLQRLAGIDEDEAQRILNFTASNSNSHSAWLTFIYPRLYIARELLSNDGVIFISIDDNEQAQLKMLCDEVFGEENFVSDFVWQTKQAARGVPTRTMLMDNHEYILCYAKNKENFSFNGIDRSKSDFYNPDNDKRGLWRSESMAATGKQNNIFSIKDPNTGLQYTKNWAFTKDTIQNMINENLIIFPNSKDGTPRQKKMFNSYRNDKKAFVSNLGWFSTEKSTKYLMNMFGENKVFDFPKPINLLNFFAKQSLNSNDIILDFFAGSGTTADAVMQLNAEDGGNRKCISVQIDEAIDPKKNKTAYDFVKDDLKQENPTIFDITKERILRAGAKIQKDNQESNNPKDLSKQDFGFKVFETLPMFDRFFDEMDELSDESGQQALFDGTQLSNDNLTVLLTSWLVNDGIKLTCPVEKITLDKYIAYCADKNLYLMNAGFTTDDLKALLEKLDNDKGFEPNKVILFGYNFQSKHQREISEALNSYRNKKHIELDRITRY